MIVRAAALDLAVQRRLLDHNVAHSAHGRRRGPGTAPARAWSTAELAAFLAAARRRLEPVDVYRVDVDVWPARRAWSWCELR